MVEVQSTMMPLGTKAPDFQLSDPYGRLYSLSDFENSKGLLVIFMCNHCPFVKHVRDQLAKLAKEYQDKGVAVVGINSNDASVYPDDSPDKMQTEIEEAGYTFPYLIDESQEVAKAYSAACTPDFFLFDENRQLVYRGQMDDSRPGNDKPNDGSDLRAALDALLAGEQVPVEQKPSAGCNIKWKPGNEPDYFKS
jgi:peroxiredoxin